MARPRFSKRCVYLALAGLLAGNVAFHADGASPDPSQQGLTQALKAAATPVGEQEEIAIGRDLVGQLLGASPLTSDPALQAYVNKIGRWIASQSERPDLPWRFGVIETSSVNAYAAPGGFILVGRPLYEILETEAELAGVLAHAVATIARRQHITVMQKGAILLSLAAPTPSNASSDSHLRSQVRDNFKNLLARGLDKAAVFEADQGALVLAARAGYNPYGLLGVLHKLQARRPGPPTANTLFETHPLPGERIDKLGAAIIATLSSLPAGREPPIRRVSLQCSPL